MTEFEWIITALAVPVDLALTFALVTDGLSRLRPPLSYLIAHEMPSFINSLKDHLDVSITKKDNETNANV
jgi:hypothetical protein